MPFPDEEREKVKLDMDSICVAQEIISIAVERVNTDMQDRVLNKMVPQFVNKQALIFAGAPLELDMHFGDQCKFEYEEEELEEPVSGE